MAGVTHRPVACDWCEAGVADDERLFVASPNGKRHICEFCVETAQREINRHKAEHGIE
jgi:hypothetical protein